MSHEQTRLNNVIILFKTLHWKILWNKPTQEIHLQKCKNEY